MNLKKLIEKEQYKYFPYNYRFIEIVKKDNSQKEKKTVEIPKTQSISFQNFFYKAISRIQ